MNRLLWLIPIFIGCLCVMFYLFGISNIGGYGKSRQAYFVGDGCLAVDIIAVGDDTIYSVGNGRYAPWDTHKLLVPEIEIDSPSIITDSFLFASGKYGFHVIADSVQATGSGRTKCVSFSDGKFVDISCPSKMISAGKIAKWKWLYNYHRLDCR